MPKTYLNQWRWPNSKRTDHYTISQNYDETFECSCPAWTNRFPRVDCKHIKDLKADPEALRRGVRYAVLGNK